MTSGNPTLGNRYHLTSRIATGGMGEVWRAEDELLGREVAVKLLRQHVAADPAFRERFRSEARITAGLTDSGVAQVFDYGETDGVAYLVMELVPGEPLSAILARSGALSPEVTLDVICQASKGLAAAHRAGIIHRDIKPGNLLVTESGLIKITDFGIARALEAAPVTQTGTVLGTAQYVSPEQASGSTLTPSTDIYSLGVVAYECLAGRPPFTAPTQVALALHHLNDPPPPLPESVPAPVRGLVGAMLAKDPADRPASARELGDRVIVLRDSLGGVNMVELSTLTDPAGFAVNSRTSPSAHTQVLRPGDTRPHGVPPTGRRPDGSPSRAGRPTRGRRRRAMVVFATAGCAAAVGLGFLAVNEMRDSRTTQGTGNTMTPTATTPSARPSKTISPKASRPATPATSTRPSVSPSATVGTSAPPTPEPTPTPSPTPIPTPMPTPTTTPSEAPTLTTSPSGASTPNAVT